MEFICDGCRNRVWDVRKVYSAVASYLGEVVLPQILAPFPYVVCDVIRDVNVGAFEWVVP